ncbi:MAG: DUF927 domain-containing protein [Candidatus Thermoplasmatota archaeon]
MKTDLPVNAVCCGEVSVRPSEVTNPVLQRVLEKLSHVRRCANGFIARCPAHDDKKASLSITEDAEGNVLLHCFAGCAIEAIVAAIGLALRDLFAKRVTPVQKQDRVFSTLEIRSRSTTRNLYFYRDRDGSPLFLVVRTDTKQFYQYRSVGPDSWQKGLGDTKRVLYRLPEILQAVKAERRIFIVEGEKDVENLVAIGLEATCNPMGAGKWRDEYSQDLRGARVVILPDNDTPGTDHAKTVSSSLLPIADEVRLVPLLGLSEKGDVSDWLAVGNSREDLESLVLKTFPLGKEEVSAFAQEMTRRVADEHDKALEKAREVSKNILDRLRENPESSIEPEVYEALALLRRSAPADWVNFKRSLVKYRIPQQAFEKAVRAAQKAHLRLVAPDETPTPGVAGAMLPDAPVPDLTIPDGYFLNDDRTIHEVENSDGEPELHTIAFAPILITGHLYDEEEGISSLRLEWRRPTGWRKAIVDRGVALDARRSVCLASLDFPISSENSRAVVRYLASFEAANYASLPRARISSRLGWQGKKGALGFLWGRTLINSDGEILETNDLDDQQSTGWKKNFIAFRGQTAGDEQIADAYRSKGTLDAWINAVRLLDGFPRAQLAVYAAFVPPLLPILEAPNFIIDWCGRTSTGKTTTLRVAASVWGRAEEYHPESVISTWDATKVWTERASSILNGLPLILDDTKRVRHPNQVAELLYAVASGRGRGRGNLKSTAVTRHWRTVLLSSGEAPATSFTQDGGTRTRSIEVRGLPFGRSDETSGALVNRLSLAIKSNYGHAGPAVVRWLIQHKARWGHFAEDYRRRAEEYAKGGSNEAGRLAQYAAAIDMAAALVHEALDRPWSFKSPLDVLWKDIAREAQDAAGEARTLQDLYAWACRHETSFYGRHRTADDGTPLYPRGEAFGRWDGDEGWEFIAFSPDVLNRLLKELGHQQPEAILSGWKERGWLDADSDKYTRQCRMGEGKKPRLVIIRRSALVEVEI